MYCKVLFLYLVNIVSVVPLPGWKPNCISAICTWDRIMLSIVLLILWVLGQAASNHNSYPKKEDLLCLCNILCLCLCNILSLLHSSGTFPSNIIDIIWVTVLDEPAVLPDFILAIAVSTIFLVIWIGGLEYVSKR